MEALSFSARLGQPRMTRRPRIKCGRPEFIRVDPRHPRFNSFFFCSPRRRKTYTRRRDRLPRAAARGSAAFSICLPANQE